MGCWDTKCIICSLPPRANKYLDDDVEIPKKIYNKIKWLNNCLLLLPNGDKIKGDEISCNIEFETKLGLIEFTPNIKNTSLYPKKGLFIHEDCYKFIKKEFNLELKFNHFPYHLIEFETFKGLNYGLIKKYHQQFLNYEEIFNDKNEWLLFSPLKDKKNANRIKKFISQFKITKSEVKKRISRPSPFISASIMPDKTFALGNDKNIYVKKNGKWTKTESFIINLSLINLDNKFKYARLIYKNEVAFNTNKLFLFDIISINGKKVNKGTSYNQIKKCKIEIIGSKDDIKLFVKENKKYIEE
ncbi:MAG: hypothetical protein CMF62_00270 [Magnetococcales bacterium]|nr:hypothetical protein [Magnetococcales bacterium]|tara:strand:+ start:1334 stop:2233 length:900 start_codon:yes stop_codon:yes gene_type:complete